MDRQDSKLWKKLDKIETLIIDAIGETDYTVGDLKIRAILEAMEGKIKDIMQMHDCLDLLETDIPVRYIHND